MPPTDPAVNTDLVIDIGNSRTKLALFTGDRISRHGSVVANDADGLRTFLGGSVPRRIGVGSVSRDMGWDAEIERIAPVHILTGASPSPLTVTYQPSLSLGVDRLANAVAANAMFPGRAVIAIDLGSCITYDLVSAQAVYLGGAISPGAHMRARAMNAFSARLPLVDPQATVDVSATSTEGSLSAGIHRGIQYELEGWIAALRYQHPDLAVVLTGGDAPRFTRALKSGIFAVPLLTLLGLHVLLEHTNGHDGPDRGAGGR